MECDIQIDSKGDFLTLINVKFPLCTVNEALCKAGLTLTPLMLYSPKSNVGLANHDLGHWLFPHTSTIHVLASKFRNEVSSLPGQIIGFDSHIPPSAKNVNSL